MHLRGSSVHRYDHRLTQNDSGGQTMVTPATHGWLFLLALATAMVVSQLYFPPRVESKWRTRLRWLFYLGAAVVTALVVGRLYEFYRSFGL